MTTNLSTERLEQFIRQPLDNGLTRGEQMEMSRELLALREASKQVVAWTEKCEITNMQATGLYLRGFPDNSQGRDIPLYTASQPAVVPDEVTFEQAMMESYKLSPAEAYQKAWNACLAVILNAK
jgi:hypothetical protein